MRKCYLRTSAIALLLCVTSAKLDNALHQGHPFKYSKSMNERVIMGDDGSVSLRLQRERDIEEGMFMKLKAFVKDGKHLLLDQEGKKRLSHRTVGPTGWFEGEEEVYGKKGFSKYEHVRSESELGR